MPNAITPDGDLVNDVFKVEASCPVIDFHLEIFDRWGRIVFESHDASMHWQAGYEGNGTYAGYFVQDAVYHYRLTFKWGTDQGISVSTETQVGWLSVLR